MSTWIEIKNQEDVDFDDSPMSESSIDVFIGSDNFGANYVTIPVSFIINVLREQGYEIS